MARRLCAGGLRRIAALIAKRTAETTTEGRTLHLWLVLKARDTLGAELASGNGTDVMIPKIAEVLGYCIPGPNKPVSVGAGRASSRSFDAPSTCSVSLGRLFQAGPRPTTKAPGDHRDCSHCPRRARARQEKNLQARKRRIAAPQVPLQLAGEQAGLRKHSPPVVTPAGYLI